MQGPGGCRNCAPLTAYLIFTPRSSVNAGDNADSRWGRATPDFPHKSHPQSLTVPVTHPRTHPGRGRLGWGLDHKHQFDRISVSAPTHVPVRITPRLPTAKIMYRSILALPVLSLPSSPIKSQQNHEKTCGHTSQNVYQCPKPFPFLQQG